LDPGQSLGHYRILRLLGQGGMGAVYLAEDTKLHRQVALKILPTEMAANPDRLERFQREAQAIAALNHPHIVTIHSVEEVEGTHFLTMELVDGESLDHRIPAGGMPLAKVFDVGLALADALAAAHEKGIVHRDLKPANIMVTKDERVKVLDFGLAKLAQGASTAIDSMAPTEIHALHESLTHPGMVVGTVLYMSPEQVGGETLDARSDIFSLGVVLYEMSTGRRPFAGKNPAETISSILRDAPRPVSETRQDAPRHLSRIIEHCLQKEPRDRYQTARDVHNELRALRRELETGVSAPVQVSRGSRMLWIGTAASAVVAIIALVLFLGRSREAAPESAGPETRSIAVLPFVNMSSDPEQEYFSDGVSEEILNLLARIPELRVTSRSSAFSFKGQTLEIPEIARRLHVAHILEGSVRKSGNEVRVTAQLIEAGSDIHLWSRTYDRTLEDIFAIQDQIAADVVRQLRVTLLGTAPTARKTDPQAYALYLQAVQLGRQFKAEAFERSDALSRKVLEIDPRYAPAWAGLARNSLNESNIGLLSSEEAFARARNQLARALEIDPEHAPTLAMLGTVEMLTGNLAGAVRHLERALELDPADPISLGQSSVLLDSLGRLEDGLPIKEFLVARDPVNATSFHNAGITYRSLGRLNEALASFRTALSLNPGQGGAHFQVGETLLLEGEPEAALQEMQEESAEAWRTVGLPMAYHALGRKAESDAALAELIRKYEKDGPFNIAYVFAFRGEADRAFEWLDKAVQYGDPGLSEILHESLFANIRKDSRWLPFLRRIGKAPEQLAAIKLDVRLP
jgi:TolB-like protein/Tfp pilus assembly protein PilF